MGYFYNSGKQISFGCSSQEIVSGKEEIQPPLYGIQPKTGTLPGGSGFGIKWILYDDLEVVIGMGSGNADDDLAGGIVQAKFNGIFNNWL